jgi:hypothetical protein
VVANATVCKQGSLLADLNLPSARGLYKNFTRLYPSEFELLLHLIRGKNLELGHEVQENISVQERLALTRGNSHVSLQYLFRISKQAIGFIVPEVCDALVEKLKDCIQVRQMLLFVVYERSLKLDCNQNFYLNTTFTETPLLKDTPNYSKSTGILISSSEEFVDGEILSVGKF